MLNHLHSFGCISQHNKLGITFNRSFKPIHMFGYEIFCLSSFILFYVECINVNVCVCAHLCVCSFHHVVCFLCSFLVVL